jgi:hypothetical protein
MLSELRVGNVERLAAGLGDENMALTLDSDPCNGRIVRHTARWRLTRLD